MRVLVTGGRDYRDREAVWRKLDEIQPSVVIHGGASGVDRAAGAWAQARGIPEIVMPYAKTFGVRGGPIRNGWMLEHCNPNIVLAFPGGKGTENMVQQAKRRRYVSVLRVAPKETT